MGFIADTIDWLGRNMKRIKVVVAVVVTIVLCLAILQNKGYRSKMSDLVEKTTGLELKNDVLRDNVEERDGQIAAKDLFIEELVDSLGSSRQRIVILESEYGHLKAEFEGLSDSIRNISPDTSYHFLVNEAYPYPGHLEYPFNAPQVKGIHATFLERNSLVHMKRNLEAQIDEKDNQLEILDTTVYEQAAQMELMRSTRQDLDSLINNQDEIIETKDEQIKEVKRSKTIWQAILGGIILLISAISIAG
jgi:hypothetical protein